MALELDLAWDLELVRVWVQGLGLGWGVEWVRALALGLD